MAIYNLKFNGPDVTSSWWRLYGSDEIATADDKVYLSWEGSTVATWDNDPDITSLSVNGVTYYRGQFKVLTQPEGNTFVYAEAWGVGVMVTDQPEADQWGVELRDVNGVTKYSTVDTTWNYIGSFLAPAGTVASKSFPGAANFSTNVMRLQYDTIPGNQDASLHTVTVGTAANGWTWTAYPSEPKGVNVTDPSKNNKYTEGVTNKIIGASVSTLVILLGR